jgi:aldose 1-epimerase
MAASDSVVHLGEQGVRLSAGDLEAIVIPSAGMVVASLRSRGDELLGRADALAGWVDGANTMGIPLLHPWANRIAGTHYVVGETPVRIDPASPLLHRDGNGLPIHGLLGPSSAWQAAPPTATESSARLSATLDASDVPGLLGGFPFPHRLKVVLDLGADELAISITLTATGDVAVPIAFGWHPYFEMPHVPRAEWELELPMMSALELDDLQLPTGVERPFDALRTPLGSLLFDDAFGDVEPGAVFAIGGGGHRVAVSFDDGYPYAQVFAPADQDVVALEPMTAPGNALVSGTGLGLVPPGETHRALFTVHVQ